MAQGLQLEIFSIGIKSYKSKHKQLLNFSELLDKIGKNKDEAYHKFISDFRNLFDGKFQSDIKKTKLLHLPKMGIIYLVANLILLIVIYLETLLFLFKPFIIRTMPMSLLGKLRKLRLLLYLFI